MKILVKQSLLFIKNSVYFISFLLRLVRINHYRNPLEKKQSGTVAVLANGPSLKDALHHFTEQNRLKYTDYIVLNNFAFDESFFIFKPGHYCLADHMFFQQTHREINVKKLFFILEQKVDWKMKLYIPSHNYKKFIEYSGIKNKNIQIIKVNTTLYEGFERLRFFFYRKGLAMPKVQTVANLSIFVGLNSGYQQLDLYGVDHTFFDSICVNDKNQLCNKELHFYTDGQGVLKPIRRNDNDEIFQVSDYLVSIMNMFKSHDLLAKYSKYLNVKIINCTKISMIDSYERKKV